MLAKLRQLIGRSGRPDTTRRFDAAGGGRRWDARPSFGPIGPEVLAAAAPVRARARYFAANNPWAASGVSALVTGLIGAGITPASLHPDPETRALLGRTFAAWCSRADADGITDFFGLQAAAAQALVIDGEAFFHAPATGDGLRLRLIPAEMVDASHTVELGNGRRIVAGIEFDASGTRVAYYVSPVRPTDTFTNYAPPVRVPASEIVHLFRPMGAGQVRGISWLAPVLLRLSETDQLEDALLVGAKVAAMHAGFLIDQNSTGANPYGEGESASGVLETGLEPGTLKFLPQGWDVRFSAPQQAHDSIAFAQLQLRAVAAGLGVPEHLLTGDLRGANYSSLRAGLVAFRQRLEQIQFHTIIPQLMRPVWERVIMLEMLRGAIDAPGFESAMSDWLAVEFYPPAQPWVDPLKDIQAEAAAVQNGFKSRRQVVASQGYAVEDLDAEISADRAREAGLKLQFGKPAAQPRPAKEPPNASA